jgi:hypothetical protein
MPSSGMLGRVALVRANVSEELSVSFIPEDTILYNLFVCCNILIIIITVVIIIIIVVIIMALQSFCSSLASS